MPCRVKTIGDLLQNCGCAQFEDVFAGLTLYKIRHYGLQDFWKILPGDEGRLAAGRILRELERLNNDPVEDENSTRRDDTKPEPGQQASSSTVDITEVISSSSTMSSSCHDVVPKDEKAPESSSSSKSGIPIDEKDTTDTDSLTDDDDEEDRKLFPEASSSGPTGQKPVIEVSLTDSEEDEDEGQNQNSTQTDEDSESGSRYSFRQRKSTQNSEDDSLEPPAQKKSKSCADPPSAELNSESLPFVEFSSRKFRKILKDLKRDPSLIENCVNVQIIGATKNLTGELQPHNCSAHDFKPNRLKEWWELFKICGPKIRHLELVTWTWLPLTAKCPYNLFRMLVRYCPHLTALTISREAASNCLKDKLKFPHDFKIRWLKTLKITHAGELNYRPQFEHILKAVSNLKKFEYLFPNFGDVNFVLDSFKGLKRDQLKNLRSLSIRSFSESGYLKAEQFNKLGQLEAGELEELELGNGLWEDIEGPIFEQGFRRFPKLQKITIYGNFQGVSIKKPEILIKFPPLSNLQYLNIGGNYEFASIFEDELDQQNSDLQQSAEPRVITIDDKENDQPDLFSVSLTLDHVLPNLETIILGNLFKINNLHFASLPKLNSFRVGSPWHLTVKFPPEESRKSCYPLITEVQLPDCLKDESFVRTMASRFPNLKKCWISLPTARVLRSFFKTMGDSPNFTELYLKTQFDFQCTMETCLVEKPTEARSTSVEDFMALEDLYKYEKFEDFIKFHNIELPPTKGGVDLEGEEYAGVKALKKLKVFKLEHVGRRLRIPQGNLHFTDSRCQFTNQYLGLKQYHLSKKCLAQLPLGRTKISWPNFRHHAADFYSLEGYGKDFWYAEAKKVVKEKKGEQLKVRIQPAMLQADFTFHQKQEKK